MNGYAAVFLEALPPPVRDRFAALRDLRALDADLTALLERAQRRWPHLAISTETFVRYIAERVDREVEPEVALAGLHAEDLYIACGCATGDAAALASFAATYFPDVEAMVTAIGGEPALADEVKQLASQKLFLAVDGTVPRIGDYGGRGDLKTWFRVIATRMAVSLLRARSKEQPLDDESLEALPSPSADPDLVLLRRRYEVDFKAAFAAAVDQLTRRERNVLRQHLLHGLSIDEIGAMYHVHRTTAYRWVARAREHVWAETRAALERRLRVSPSELRGLVEDVRSRLDLSIERALQTR